MIGFLNIGKARKIFTLLHDGRELRYIHPSYGEAMVSMNPQKNRILVTEHYKNNIGEANIIDFIIRGVGDW